MALETPNAGPSTASLPQPGASAYHVSSHFRHWRYSPAQLAAVRQTLNEKSRDVTMKNIEREKEAQLELGHKYAEPPQPSAYPSVADELLLLRFYATQISAVCRKGFGLPDVVEGTAITYLKRFYLKNSVMEYHPKVIMPTCLFLAAKTTNHIVVMSDFIPKFARLSEDDVLEHEFVVAQSLAFEFWVRGAEKALRGWGLEFQEMEDAPVAAIQSALPRALENLTAARHTDAEFLFTPSQLGLACWRLADPALVSSFLEWRYANYLDSAGIDGAGSTGNGMETSAAEQEPQQGSLPYGITRERLEAILDDVQVVVQGGQGEIDVKTVKAVDKRLRGCSNPEKVPGTALYKKRKAEQDRQAAEKRSEKAEKAARSLADRENVFGGTIPTASTADRDTVNGTEVGANTGMSIGVGVGVSTGIGASTGMSVGRTSRSPARPMSPRVSLGVDRGIAGGGGGGGGA